MKRELLLSFVLAMSFLVLCACAGPAPTTAPTTAPTAAPTTESTTEPTIQPTMAPTNAATAEPTDAPTEPVYIYENAMEDYLLPLEEYSDDRVCAPEFVMIHFTSAVVEHRKDPYNMQYVRDIFVDYNISVHYVVDRDGTVRCYIPENRVAWHAGRGEFGGDSKYTNKMNQYAIGIEVLAIGSEEDMSIYLTSQEYHALDDSLKGYTQEQYDALKLLVADLCERYDIPMDRTHVIGHEEYSPQKTDPGELFDWNQIIPAS